MATPYLTLIDMFFRRIEKDKNFFDYFNLSDYESLELARSRASAYLDEAVAHLMMQGQPTIDFSDVDIINRQFNFDLTSTEKLLVSSLMYQFYLDRDIAYLKVLNVNYARTDLRVFDPSNARSTFLDMYMFVCKQNAQLMDSYKNSDRLTGAYRSTNPASYDFE